MTFVSGLETVFPRLSPSFIWPPHRQTSDSSGSSPGYKHAPRLPGGVGRLTSRRVEWLRAEQLKELHLGVDPELAEDGGEVVADGARADVELCGHGCDAIASAEAAQDLPLSRRQL